MSDTTIVGKIGKVLPISNFFNSILSLPYLVKSAYEKLGWRPITQDIGLNALLGANDLNAVQMAMRARGAFLLKTNPLPLRRQIKILH